MDFLRGDLSRRELAQQYGPLSFPIYYGSFVAKAASNDRAQLAATAVGYLVFLYLLLRTFQIVWGYFLRPSSLPIYCHAEEGSWALVTGASDGIGRAFAEDLIGRGFNIVLHGRNPEKIAKVKRALNLRFPKRGVETVIADAASPDHPEDILVEKVKQLPGKLTVLVNNVGGIITRPTYSVLEDLPASDIDTCINVNARFPTQLTRALLPTLQKNGPALIINCSSTASVTGVPYIVTYAGTKGFVNAFTQALQTELSRSNVPGKVEVIAYVIGNVISNNNKTEVPLVTMSSAQCAAGCLARVGCGKAVTYGHWKHALTVDFMSFLPAWKNRSLLLAETGQRMEDEKKEL